jgi:hypothetical protein
MQQTIRDSPMISSDQKTINISEELKPKVNIELINDSINDLNEGIKIIAKRIGGKTRKYFKNNSLLTSTNNREELDSKLTKYIEEILVPAIKSIED